MYIIQNRWVQFKQEFLTLAFLIIMNSSWFYYADWYGIWGQQWRFVGNLATVLVLCFMILFPDKLLPSCSIKYMQRKSPESRKRMRKIHNRFLLICSLIILLFERYMGYLKFSNIEYVAFYITAIIGYLLMGDSLERYYAKAHDVYKKSCRKMMM
jgi:uncharacterized membrane protein